MDKKAMIIASVLSALVIIGFVGLSAWERSRELDKTKQELEAARGANLKTAEQASAQSAAFQEQLAKAQTIITDLKEEKETLQAGHEASKKQGEVLQSEKEVLKKEANALKRETEVLKQEKAALLKENEKVAAAQKTLEQEMRGAIESKDITISQLQGRLTVNILDRILFDSGEADLKADGERVLKQIAGILAQYPKRQIQVIGHTDNVPIRVGSKSGFASNWELSTARATAAVRFLAEKANVDPHRLGALGYGEFHPLADNTTAEGRAKNRRIALVVLAEEISVSDVPAPAAPAPLSLPPKTDN